MTSVFRLRWLMVGCAWLVGTSVAFAQPTPAADPPAPTAGAPVEVPAAAPMPVPAVAPVPAPSPEGIAQLPVPAPPVAGKTDPALRTQCMSALAVDADWTADVVRQVKASHAKELDGMSLDRHRQDAQLIAKNKRHVVLAYAALWLLTTGFVVLLFMRQRKQRDEIGRLRAALDKELSRS